MQPKTPSPYRMLATAVAPVAAALGLILGGCQSSSPFASASGLELTFISAAQTWDLNKDNVVTCDEWKAYSTQAFREGDANGDRVVSGADFTIWADNFGQASLAIEMVPEPPSWVCGAVVLVALAMCRQLRTRFGS